MCVSVKSRSIRFVNSKQFENSEKRKVRYVYKEFEREKNNENGLLLYGLLCDALFFFVVYCVVLELGMYYQRLIMYT